MKNNLILFSLIAVLLFSCKDKNVDMVANKAKEVMNVSYGSDTLQKMDLYFPEGFTQETPVVFLIHGGGFIDGTK